MHTLSSLETPSSLPLTQTFDAFHLPSCLVGALKNTGIHTPTPIQAGTISPAIQGQDVIATAQTGTGKTLAYTLPVIMRLLNAPQDNALILAPTRELAAQVYRNIEQLLQARSAFNIALLVRGESIGKQFAQLRRSPRIIIATRT